MGKTIGLGIQTFDKIRERHCFYIDKTALIKEWWDNGDDVTLIARPRRFGKTLNMSMLEQFLSVQYRGSRSGSIMVLCWDFWWISRDVIW